MTNPIIWVAIVGWLLAAGVYGFEKVQQGRQWQVAYAAGKSSSSVATVSAAVETANEERKALEDTPLPKDKTAIIERCKRSASCRERGKL